MGYHIMILSISKRLFVMYMFVNFENLSSSFLRLDYKLSDFKLNWYGVEFSLRFKKEAFSMIGNSMFDTSINRMFRIVQLS